MGFYQQVIKLDELMANKKPQIDDLDEVKNIIAKPSVQNYFWRNLDHKSWLPDLYKNGFFQPLMTKSNDNEILQIQYQLAFYLQKVAPSYSNYIIKIIKNSSITSSNPLVIRVFAEIGLTIRPNYTAKLVPQVKKWTKSNNSHSSMSFADELIKWINHLASDNKFSSSLRLLKILTTPIKQNMGVHKNKELENLLGEDRIKAVPVLEIYYMKELLDSGISEIVKHKPFEVAEILANALNDSIKIEYSYLKGNSDHSFIWRPAIEDHSQNYEHYEINEILVVTLRNILEKYIAENSEKGFEVIENFLNHKYSIFRRLAIHLLRVYYNEYMDYIKGFIKNVKLFNNMEIYHEFYLLLRDIYKVLDTEERKFIIYTIKSYERFDKSEKEDVQEIQKKYYWYEKLYYFEDYLEGSDKDFFENLKKEFKGEPRRDTVTWSESYYGEKSPVSLEEIEGKDNSEIWDLIVNYKIQDKDFNAPTYDGFARVFAALVSKNISRFLNDDLSPLLQARANYSYWFLHQIVEELKTDKYFSYKEYIKNILDFCSEIIKVEVTFAGEPTNNGQMSFNEVKRRVLELIRALIQTHQKEFPIEYKDKIWESIKYLCFYNDDPDDSPITYSNSSMDPYTLAINSVRGMAVQVLIDYALWYAFHTKEKHEGFIKPNRLAGEEQRVLNILESKLDKRNDQSLAVHSIFGVCFANLAYLNFNWVEKNIDKIFPSNETLTDYWKAAWSGYVNASRFYRDLFELLKPQFNRALKYLENNEKIFSGFGRTPEDALSEHLIIASANGLDDIFNEDSILRRFAKVVNNPSAIHAVQFIANLAKDQKVFLDIPEVRKSFWPEAKKYWEIRTEVVSKFLSSNQETAENNFEREFAIFFSWLDDLPVDVTIEDLKDLLNESIKINQSGWYLPDFIEYLHKQSESYPLVVINLIHKLTKTNAPSHFYFGKEKKIEEIILNAINNDTLEKNKKSDIYYLANKIVNKFGEWGNYSFKELWKKYLKDKKVIVNPHLRKID